MSGPAAAPLAGRRIVVTRARAQAASLAGALEALGAQTLRFAAIRTEPVQDPEPLRGALAAIPGYDWIVLTSVNGVDALWSALDEPAREALLRVRCCAIGSATAAEILRRGGRVDLVPARHLAEGALEALLEAGAGPGTRVLLARAAEGRAVLPDGLRAQGVQVDDLALYRTLPSDEGAGTVREALKRGEADAVTFTAGSTVRSFADRIGTALGGALTASIGPATSAALRERGLPVDIEAEEHTVPGLVRALVERLGARERG